MLAMETSVVIRASVFFHQPTWSACYDLIQQLNLRSLHRTLVLSTVTGALIRVVRPFDASLGTSRGQFLGDDLGLVVETVPQYGACETQELEIVSACFELRW
jgi:hypothetical protein